MKIENQVERLKPELDSLVSSQKSVIEDLQAKTQCLMEIAYEGDDNWAGTWASESYNYYHNFVQRKNEMVILNEEQIQKYIEKKGRIAFDEIRKQISVIVNTNKEFKEKLITELSIIKGQSSLEPEIEILNKIEKQKWGISASDLIDKRKPSKVIVQNPAMVLNKGLQIPPHIKVAADVTHMFSTLASVNDFHKNAKRLLRQLEIKFEMKEVPEEKTDFIVTLINSFHSVARQIRNRHANRETIGIKDEYDVQDLFHALLKIQFEDIRAEENTPSYAGSGARVDFLLKKEKTVIEIKKTRENLTDKEIGGQLILDAHHYNAHPDCKKLICFVYDPENRVENPRGLESDLNQLTSDELIVEVYIRP